jgi:hypothetical protein
VRILTRDAAWPKPPWEDVVAAAVAEAQRIGAVLLCVDTGAYWAGQAHEREKDSGAALEVMQPLVDAAAAGPAVFGVWHHRKGGGEDGEGIRGSSAFAGAADIILELERVQDRPRQRVLQALSRFPSTPGSLLFDLDTATGAWRVICEDAERGNPRDLGDRQALIDAFDNSDDGLSLEELEAITGSPRRQWHASLKALEKDQIIVRVGGGKKGDPYRFEKPKNSAHKAACAECAETPTTGGSFSGAHPVGVHQKRNQPEQIPIPRTCAETESADDSDAALFNGRPRLPVNRYEPPPDQEGRP